MKLEWRTVAPTPYTSPVDTTLTDTEINKLRWLSAGADVLEIEPISIHPTMVMALSGAQVTVAVLHEHPALYADLQDQLKTYDVESRVTVMRKYNADSALTSLESEYDLVWIDRQTDVIRRMELAVQLLRPDIGIMAVHHWNVESYEHTQLAITQKYGMPQEIVGTIAIYRGLR